MKRYSHIYLLLLFIVSCSESNESESNGLNQSATDWQNTLSDHFDIVSTFDDLDDWKGSRPSNTVDIETYPNEFPVKTLDKSVSIWQYYSLYESPGSDNWIQNHGTENVWLGKGKSMCIDYSNGSDGINRGPSRLAFKIGNSPEDGYDTVYLFFMTKWFKDFFKMEPENSAGFAYHRFLKTLDVSAGFKSVRWGTDEEHNWVADQGGSTQVLHEYGLNAQVYNYYSYGITPRSEVINSTILTTNTIATGYEDEVIIMSSAKVGQPILNNEWFGVEYRIKKSNPHGSATGEIEIWVYNQNGTRIAHQLTTGIVTFRDGNSTFNHKWNKFVWGGNRFAGSYCPSGDPLCDFSSVDHFYIDDVIVDDSRIGPSYFSILNEKNNS